MKENKKDSNKTEKSQDRLKIVLATIILSVVLVVLVFGGVYFAVVNKCNSIADKVTEIYATGTGADLKELIPASYVKYCEENFKSLSVEESQETHIYEFRNKVEGKVGNITSIKGTRTGILTASNIDEYAGDYAEFGVTGITKYRCVTMRWEIFGDKGSTVMDVNVYVFKSNDGWCLDYVEIP